MTPTVTWSLLFLTKCCWHFLRPSLFLAPNFTFSHFLKPSFTFCHFLDTFFDTNCHFDDTYWDQVTFWTLSFSIQNFSCRLLDKFTFCVTKFNIFDTLKPSFTFWHLFWVSFGTKFHFWTLFPHQVFFTLLDTESLLDNKFLYGHFLPLLEAKF